MPIDSASHEPLLPRLGGRAWLALGINTVSCLGSGLTMPFLIIYLSQARGMSLDRAGLVISVIGITALAVTPLTGPLVDRVGSVRAFAIGLVLGGVGIGAFGLATTWQTAMLCSVAYGAGSGLMWNGFATLLAGIVPPGERGSVFAMRYMSANVAFGLGALVSGFLTVSTDPKVFAVIFAVDAASYVLFAGTVLALSRRLAPLPQSEPSAPSRSRADRPAYRTVLRDRALLGVTLANAMLFVVALSSSNSVYPAWVSGEGGGDTSLVGLGFGLNISVLIAVQLLGIKVARRRRRTDVASVAALAFAVTWVVVALPTSLGVDGLTRAVLLVLALGVFAIGEALLSPTLPAIVNDLSSDELRGRYNAVFSIGVQMGPVVAPALAGLALGSGHGLAYLYVLATACLLVAGYLRWLGRVVPDEANLHPEHPARRPVPEAVDVDSALAGAPLTDNQSSTSTRKGEQ